MAEHMKPREYGQTPISRVPETRGRTPIATVPFDPNPQTGVIPIGKVTPPPPPKKEQ